MQSHGCPLHVFAENLWPRGMNRWGVRCFLKTNSPVVACLDFLVLLVGSSTFCSTFGAQSVKRIPGPSRAYRLDVFAFGAPLLPGRFTDLS
jgi:hypothetical protein